MVCWRLSPPVSSAGVPFEARSHLWNDAIKAAVWNRKLKRVIWRVRKISWGKSRIFLANGFEHSLCCVTSLFGQANFRYVRTVSTSVECSALVDNATNDRHNLWSIRCNIVHLIFFQIQAVFRLNGPGFASFGHLDILLCLVYRITNYI